MSRRWCAAAGINRLAAIEMKVHRGNPVAIDDRRSIAGSSGPK
jgi:hypothetical protein